MAARIGLNAKMYYTPLLNPVGGAPWNTPTPTTPWPATSVPTDAANTAEPMAELSNVRDVTLNLNKSTADITTRAGNGWRQVVGVLKDGTVEFEMVWDLADLGFANISHAYFNDKHIYLGVMDGDAADSTTGYRMQGLYSPFSVLDLSRSEGLEEALIASVTVQPTFVSGYNPEWVDRTI